jgi:hypothetical protein
MRLPNNHHQCFSIIIIIKGEVKQFQQVLIAKNREQEEENKRARCA